MKIKMVECEQFAGLQDKEIEFESGLNLVIGENETGKSTMMDLIYHLLFKHVKMDLRKDSEFVDKYFPKRKDGPDGDVIDGVLRFETASGRYKISKEWDKGTGSCKMTTPDGTIIKSADEINRILAEELGYNEGVYSEVVFASQKRQQDMVECILQDLSAKKVANDKSAVRGDLASAVSKAVMETGGVSLDKLEKKLIDILSEYAGHWDFAADSPEGGVKRGINNPWKKEIGRILASYYAKEGLAAAQESAVMAEKSVEAYKAQIQKATADKRVVQDKRNKFQQFRSILGQVSTLEKHIGAMKQALAEQEEALAKWPALEKEAKYAGELKVMLEQAQVRDSFNAMMMIKSELERKHGVLNSLTPISDDDIKMVQKLQTQQTRLESKLESLNLIARIKQLGDTPVEVKSSITGEVLPVSEGELNIKESVEIIVPGILELQLMPQGIDLEQIKNELAECKAMLTSIFKTYDVQAMDELQAKAAEYAKAEAGLRVAKGKLTLLTAGLDWEKIRKDNENIPDDIPSVKEVNLKITELCGEKTIEAFIGSVETVMAQYKEKYVSLENLKKAIESQKNELLKNQNKLVAMDEIPAEYKDIYDAEEYDAELESQVNDLDAKLVSLGESLREAERSLGEKSGEEYAEELAVAEAAFETEKTTYAHWKHIYDVFTQMKEAAKGNPMEDIEVKFKEYLSAISDGGLALEAIDEQMSARIASGKNALTYETLSEGTKDTISLAFRLAYLSHLYPEGGGLAVFDDPFTDMDPKRVKESCKLIQKYAENNQVIFVTCDEKYKSLLDGNVINV